MEAKAAGDRNEGLELLALKVVTPFALSASLFSVNAAALPFDLNPRNFAYAVILFIFMIPALQFALPLLSSKLDLARTELVAWLRLREKAQASLRQMEEGSRTENEGEIVTTDPQRNLPVAESILAEERDTGYVRSLTPDLSGRVLRTRALGRNSTWSGSTTHPSMV